MTLSLFGLSRLGALQLLAETAPVATVEFPLRLTSRANTHAHWRQLAEKHAGQRLLAYTHARRFVARLKPKLSHGLVVRVVRISPQRIDLHDNLGAACKSVIDGVAQAFGVDDRDQRIVYVPDDEDGDWGTRLEFYVRGGS